VLIESAAASLTADDEVKLCAGDTAEGSLAGLANGWVSQRQDNAGLDLFHRKDKIPHIWFSVVQWRHIQIPEPEPEETMM
jgi:hypothetical protein